MEKEEIVKIRIQNDGGHGYTTQLTDVETGKPIEHATDADVHLKINVRDVPKAFITMIMPVVDVIADAEIQHVCPVCGKPAETPPTHRTQRKNVDALVKAWEDEQREEREQEETERQVRLILQSALHDIASFAMRRTPADGFSVDDRVDSIADDMLHLLKNMAQ